MRRKHTYCLRSVSSLQDDKVFGLGGLFFFQGEFLLRLFTVTEQEAKIMTLAKELPAPKLPKFRFLLSDLCLCRRKVCASVSSTKLHIITNDEGMNIFSCFFALISDHFLYTKCFLKIKKKTCGLICESCLASICVS